LLEGKAAAAAWMDGWNNVEEMFNNAARSLTLTSAKMHAAAQIFFNALKRRKNRFSILTLNNTCVLC
jgi:hypothetical protein